MNPAFSTQVQGFAGREVGRKFKAVFYGASKLNDLVRDFPAQPRKKAAKNIFGMKQPRLRPIFFGTIF